MFLTIFLACCKIDLKLLNNSKHILFGQFLHSICIIWNYPPTPNPIPYQWICWWCLSRIPRLPCRPHRTWKQRFLHLKTWTLVNSRRNPSFNKKTWLWWYELSLLSQWKFLPVSRQFHYVTYFAGSNDVAPNKPGGRTEPGPYSEATRSELRPRLIWFTGVLIEP